MVRCRRNSMPDSQAGHSDAAIDFRARNDSNPIGGKAS